MTYRTGDSYPESGVGMVQEMELCDGCAMDLMALLHNNGYRIIEDEWDY